MNKKVIDKMAFLTNKDKFEKNIEEVEVPELNPMVGLLPVSKQAEIEKEIKDLKKEKQTKKTKEKIDELESKLGISVFKVGQINLSLYLRAKEKNSDWAQNLVDGVVAASTQSKQAVKEETENMISEMKLNPQAKYQISIVEAGVIEPKLGEAEYIWLAQMYPVVIIRLFDKIIQLSSNGATLKKNTQIC